jgi:chromosome segregation ATPase
LESRLENMEEKFKTLDQRHMTINEHVINTQLRVAALSGLVPTHDSLNATDKRLGIVEQNLTQMEERNKNIEDLDSRVSTSLENISSRVETLELKLKLEAENKVEFPPIPLREKKQAYQSSLGNFLTANTVEEVGTVNDIRAPQEWKIIPTGYTYVYNRNAQRGYFKKTK